MAAELRRWEEEARRYVYLHRHMNTLICIIFTYITLIRAIFVNSVIYIIHYSIIQTRSSVSDRAKALS